MKNRERDGGMDDTKTTELSDIPARLIEVPRVPNFLEIRHLGKTSPLSFFSDEQLRDIGTIS